MDSVIEFVGPKITCNIPALSSINNADFYKSFKHNGNSFTVNEAVFVKLSSNSTPEVCQILALYRHDVDYQTCREKAFVLRFTWANKLKHIFEKKSIEFSSKSEVVKDSTRVDVIIDLKNITGKCNLYYCHIKSPYFILHKQLDKRFSFSCRYELKHDKNLHPIDFDSINEESQQSEQINETETTEPTNYIEIVNLDSDVELDYDNILEYNKNQQSNKSNHTMNYSIIEDSPASDKPLKIRLKLSKNQMTNSKDTQNNINKENLDANVKLRPAEVSGEKIVSRRRSTRTETINSAQDNFRRSNRSINRVSYADYISPLKTPVKETVPTPRSARLRRNIYIEESENSTSSSLNLSQSNNSLKETNLPEIEETEKIPSDGRPLKRKNALNSIKENELAQNVDISPTKRKLHIRTPQKKLKDIIENNETPRKMLTRRNSVLNENVTTEVGKTPSRRTRSKTIDSECNTLQAISTTQRQTRQSSVRDQIEDPKSINSFTKTGINKSIEQRLNNTPSRSKRKNSYDYSEHDSSESEDSLAPKSTNSVKKTRNTKKIDEKVKSTPIRSKRKNSTTNSSEDDSSVTDHDLVPKSSKSVKKTRNTKLNNTLRKSNRKKSSECRKNDSDSASEEEFVPKTPKRSNKDLKYAKTPKSSNLKKGSDLNTPTKGTPKNRAKMLREGVITPSLQNRDKLVKGNNTPLMMARSNLHVSFVPNALPCREKEYSDINNFIEGKLSDGCGGCMYISGVPGTGKTATVTAVINSLLKKVSSRKIDKFDYVNINGMRLTEPRQAYVEIIKQLGYKTVPWEQAQSTLEERFTKCKVKKIPTIMVVDELDILCTKRQDVVYNLLDWPTKAKAQLIVITIANTMDLPERLLMNRVASRLGLTRLTFQAYTHKQLQDIVMKRLAGTNSFNPDAVQLVARKVASVSGDARRALDICRRAAEIAEIEGPATCVSLKHVNEALNAMITQPKLQAIKRCSKLEQLILQAIVAEMERTGVEETTFGDVYRMLISICAIEGFSLTSTKLCLAAISRLNASRLILADQKCSDLTSRLILNVSTDDIFYALRS